MVATSSRVPVRDCPRAANLLAALVFFLCLGPTSSHAQDTAPADTITAAVIADWPPYYMIGADGRPTGLAIDIFDVVAAQAGFVPRYVRYPSFAAAQAALSAGEIDVIPNMGIVEGRDFLFTTSVGAFDIGLFVRKSSPDIHSISDVRGEVAVVESNIGKRIVAEVPGIDSIVYGDVREALFRLLAGDVEAVVFASPVTWALARSARIDHQIREVPPPLAEVKRAVAVQLGREDLRTRLDREIGAFVGSAQYAAIYRRWHQPPEPFWTGKRVALVGLAVLVFAALVGAVWRVVTLRRADERIRFHAHLLDVVGEAVIATDLEGRVVFWNKFAEKLLGWTAAEAMGRPALGFAAQGDNRDEAARALSVLLSGESWRGDIVLSRRDGRTFPAHLVSTPLFDEGGEVMGTIGASTDLTERRELEDQLRQAQKMESIGRLAGGVAHDFNNLLTVIVGTTELALRDLPPGDPRRADFIEIRQAADRAAALTQQLLAFSRKQIIQPRVLDPNAVLLDAERMLRRVIGEDITVEITPGAGVGHVRVDPAQLEQVILNLAVNSRDAMPDGGTLSFATEHAEFDEDAARREGRISPGEYVVLTVRDTGAGMDEATLQRIFEPFFTTKGPGLGTGLGLSSVYGIVEQSGGVIRVASEPGVGTTFTILFPRVARPAAEVAPAPVARASTGTETILLVEDDSSVRGLVTHTLESAGYRVLVADRPPEALLLSDRHDGPIHLLLSDVVLPDTYGPDLAKRFLERRPQTRVLFMSGYADATIVEHGVASTDARLLTKPFAIETLIRTVREVLDDHAPAGGA
jgi:PAS domain S-box-containing protein